MHPDLQFRKAIHHLQLEPPRPTIKSIEIGNNFLYLIFIVILYGLVPTFFVVHVSDVD